MSEGKTLTICDYIDSESDFRKLYNFIQNNSIPNVGSSYKIDIDTIRIICLKKTIKSFLKKMHWQIETVKSHTKISSSAKRRIKNKEVSSSYRIKTPSGFNNILLETPHELNSLTNYKKFRISIYGLTQPNKPLNTEQIVDIIAFIKRLEIEELDICIDSTKIINMRKFRSFGTIDKYHTTQYLHNPIGLNYISKLCYYDKKYKDKLEFSCYRLELTCKTKGKFGELFIPIDEVQIVLKSLLSV